jgi:hypothetical protein
MFLLYHSDGYNTSETVFHWCYVNDLHTTHAVVCWVTIEPADIVQIRSGEAVAGGAYKSYMPSEELIGIFTNSRLLY